MSNKEQQWAMSNEWPETSVKKEILAALRLERSGRGKKAMSDEQWVASKIKENLAACGLSEAGVRK
jgi:hypothetical protein